MPAWRKLRCGVASRSVIYGNTFPLCCRSIAPIFRAVEQKFNARVQESVTVFRRMKADRSTYIHWHTDADGAGSWPFDPLWNCWTPLQNVGVDYPSLELITDSEALMRSVPPAHPGGRADDWVDANTAGMKRIAPWLAIGEALVFSHCVLHRTQRMAALKGDRIGFEIRFTRASAAPRPAMMARFLSAWQR